MTQHGKQSISMVMEDILASNQSAYKVVLLAAQRAVELSRGAPPLVPGDDRQPGSIALEEIRQGHVSYEITEEHMTHSTQDKDAT
jgi:DNA-directed RNA polymerase omega subunit